MSHKLIRFFSTFAAIILAVALATICSAQDMVQQQQQQMMAPPPIIEDETPGAAAIDNFFRDLKRVLMQQYISIEIWDEFEENLKMKVDPEKQKYYMKYKNSKYPLGDGKTTDFSFSIEFVPANSAADAGQDAYFEFFPGLGLLELTNVKAGSEDMERAFYEIVFTKLNMVRLADPGFSADFINAAKPGMKKLVEEFSALEGYFEPLAGFSEGVNQWSSDDRMAFGFSFEKKLGKATMGNPVGKLLEEDSCYIGLYISEYDPMANRWNSDGSRSHFYLRLQNLNLEVTWTVESKDSNLTDALYKHVKKFADEIKEIDTMLYGTKIKKRATEFWPDGAQASADPATSTPRQESIEELADSMCRFMLEDNLPGIFDLLPEVQQQEFADKLSMSIEEFRSSRPAGVASRLIESCDVVSTSEDKCNKILPFLYDHWKEKYGAGPDRCGVMKINTKMAIFTEAQTKNQYAIETRSGWKAIATDIEFETPEDPNALPQPR